MSFAREMGNVVTTGVGTLLPFLALLHLKPTISGELLQY